MMQPSSMSPLPWDASASTGGYVHIRDANGHYILRPVLKDDAKFIVHACNLHCRLVRMIDDLLDDTDEDGVELIRGSLRKKALKLAREATGDKDAED